MASRLIPISDRSNNGQGGYVAGQNSKDDPEVLSQGQCLTLENAFPGDPPTPRNGVVDVRTNDTALGYGTKHTIYEPGAIYIIAPDGDEYLFSWVRSVFDDTEYGLEMWNKTDDVRTQLCQIDFAATDVHFKMMKLYSSIYCVFDKAITANRTFPYCTHNLVIYWTGSAFSVRTLGIDTSPVMSLVQTGDAELANFSIGLTRHQSVVFNNKIFTIGGYTATSYKKIYSTSNCISWREEGTDSFPTSIYDHKCLIYNNKIWSFGGYVAGTGYVKKVYSSSDGVTWTEAGTNSLPGTYDMFLACVYNNLMWIIIWGNADSGMDSYSSSDGINWTKNRCATFPYAINGHEGCLVFNNKMWVISPANSRKVYSSSDGVTWTEAGTDALPFGMNSGSFLIYNSKMWIIGASAREVVYYSSDGTTWAEAGTDAMPGIITNHSSVVYNNKMWIVCGEISAVGLKTIYNSSTGSSWTQQIGGITKDYYSSIAFTFVKRSGSGANSATFEEPETESCEDIAKRQIVKMLCTTTTGTLLIPMPDVAEAVGKGMTHMRVWRTLGGASETVVAGLVHYFLVDLCISGAGYAATTIYHDITPDSALLGETHYLNTTGYEIAPAGRFQVFAGDRHWIGGVAAKPGYWYASEIPQNVASPMKYSQLYKTDEYFVTCDPEDNQKDTGCIFFQGSLYFFKERKIFSLANGDKDNIPQKIADLGCVCPNSITEAYSPVIGPCVLFLSDQGPAVLQAGGSVGLLESFKLSEVWPGGEILFKSSATAPTNDYSRNRVCGAFFKNAWWLTYGDSIDPSASNDFTVSRVLSFYISADKKYIGGSKHVFGLYHCLTQASPAVYTDVVIYEPRQIIPVSNSVAYTLSNKSCVGATLATYYRLSQFLKDGIFQDTFSDAGSNIAIILTARSRRLYFEPLKRVMAELWDVVCHCDLKDSSAMTFTFTAGKSRFFETAAYSQTKESELASAGDNYIRNMVQINPQEGLYGPCFDAKIVKTLPTDGTFNFYGFDLRVVPILNLQPEFSSKGGARTLSWS